MKYLQKLGKGALRREAPVVYAADESVVHDKPVVLGGPREHTDDEVAEGCRGP